MKKVLILIQFIILVILTMMFNPISNRLITIYQAKRLGLNSIYFYKQIKAESSFRCFAYSHAKAIGPGQITKDTAKYIVPELKSWRLWLPWDNIYASGRYTRYLLEKYEGNYSLALAAYNWGETNVDMKLKLYNIRVVKSINYRFLFSNVYETDAFIRNIIE